jgi:hypothetical protein
MPGSGSLTSFPRKIRGFSTPRSGSLTGFARKIRGFLTWPRCIWQPESLPAAGVAPDLSRLTLPNPRSGSLTGFARKIRGFLTWPRCIWQPESLPPAGWPADQPGSHCQNPRSLTLWQRRWRGFAFEMRCQEAKRALPGVLEVLSHEILHKQVLLILVDGDLVDTLLLLQERFDRVCFRHGHGLVRLAVNDESRRQPFAAAGTREDNRSAGWKKQ